ncbi:MAG: alpha/beta hydrolase [Candidatus Eisenbacteria bacterium]
MDEPRHSAHDERGLIAKNYALYRALGCERAFMVESISSEPVAGTPKPSDGYRAEASLAPLADAVAAAAQRAPDHPLELTLKVHGFNMRRGQFAREILHDATPPAAHTGESFLPANGFLIGYRWPSEGMGSRESGRDMLRSIAVSPAIGILLLLLPLHGLLVSGGLEQLARAIALPLAGVVGDWGRSLAGLEQGAQDALGALWPFAPRFLELLFSPFLGLTSSALWLGAGLLILLLRLSTYQRDRYRAVHYGVPDLGEFMRDLERALVARDVRVRVNVVAHSMGTLLSVNAFRVMSDYFHPPGDAAGNGPDYGEMGRRGTFKLGTLILCAPDLPAVMATRDRNNYFQSVLRRFASVHVFCSDRDLILKWLSPIANWASEPRYDMVGRKLGNVVLLKSAHPPVSGPDSRSDWTLWPMNRPVVRAHSLYTSDPVGASQPAVVHFHDCTLDAGLAGSYGSMALASLVVVAVLAAPSVLLHVAVFGWLASMLGSWLLLGLLARPLWPRVRDVAWLGGVVGALAEVPSLMMFATFWRGWDPHGGYFTFGRAPRQRVCELLAHEDAFPRHAADGREIEEEDAAIRYRLVRISV